VTALIGTGLEYGYHPPILHAAVEVNHSQRAAVLRKLQMALKVVKGRRVAVLGLAFKPGTDDVRQAPAVDVVAHLQNLGASVAATDPQATANAAAVLRDVDLHSDAYECCRGADAVLLVTEWPQFRSLDWERIGALVARRIVVDARNCLDAAALLAAGFRYEGVGRAAGTRRAGVDSPAAGAAA
jgi:UDPglucose 6-dehydrogenase